MYVVDEKILEDLRLIHFVPDLRILLQTADVRRKDKIFPSS